MSGRKFHLQESPRMKALKRLILSQSILKYFDCNFFNINLARKRSNPCVQYNIGYEVEFEVDMWKDEASISSI